MKVETTNINISIEIPKADEVSVKESDLKVRHSEKEPAKENIITEERVDKIVKKLNNNSDVEGSGVKFEKDKDLDKWIVKVFNEKTGETIRQIPSKEILAIEKGLEEVMGKIFDKKA